MNSIASCLLFMFGVLCIATALICVKPKPVPPIYFDGKDWYTDGSFEMTKRALAASKLGESIFLRGSPDDKISGGTGIEVYENKWTNP